MAQERRRANPPGTSYAVSIDPGTLRFSAAHFITYGGTCENLHGHNFHVRVGASGRTGSDALVVDFVLLTELARAVCDRLHDKVLLPADSAEMTFEERDACLHVASHGRRFAFPAENCLLLPLVNTTAEMLARYIGDRLLDALRARGQAGLHRLDVAVEEADRQWGIVTREFAQDD